MFNHIEKDEKWLDAAANICRFCLDYGRDERGVWGHLVDRKGKMLEGEKAILVEFFAGVVSPPFFEAAMTCRELFL